ncbi:hypothetical protein, partial [Acinetobacter baumannii]
DIYWFSSKHWDSEDLDISINWENNDNLPRCDLGFEYPEFDKIVWEELKPEFYKLVEINIRDVLDRFQSGESGYLLSAFKYYQVRKELSLNSADIKFHYPWVRLGGDGKYHLVDGRHRLNALVKIYGIEKIKVKISLTD